jgi:hypothetical protein
VESGNVNFKYNLVSGGGAPRVIFGF